MQTFAFTVVPRDHRSKADAKITDWKIANSGTRAETCMRCHTEMGCWWNEGPSMISLECDCAVLVIRGFKDTTKSSSNEDKYSRAGYCVNR